MQKIKFIADSACDIPDEDLARYQIDMPSVPITIDGTGYFERKSFSIREFYDLLAASSEIPATSRVPAGDYLTLYERAYQKGYTDIINVTINAGGSGTSDSARMAIQLFYEANPEAKDRLHIHMVDSKTYSLGYGYPVVQAAIRAESGAAVPELLAYLYDYFDRLEVYLACYTLDYAKKSGRISAAAAFVGDVLGVRPIISLIDGTTKIVDRVRGEKQIVARLCEIYERQCLDPSDPVLAVSAAVDSYGEELQAQLEQQLGRAVPHYKAGASIVINSGPKMAAICMLGKKRGS